MSGPPSWEEARMHVLTTLADIKDSMRWLVRLGVGTIVTLIAHAILTFLKM